ncbi:MAG: PorV/PorQ family protein [Candidatus Zixiibacteriota bacterium]
MIKRILVGWFVLVLLTALIGRVSVAAPDGGRTAADFLQIGVLANSAAMGGAYSAVAEGAGACFTNPAGLAATTRPEVLLSHFSWYQSLNLEHGSVALPLTNRLVLGGAITFLSYGSMEGYDRDGAPTGNISAYDWAGGVTVGYQTGVGLAVGVTGKFINQKLADANASTFAADIGARYQLGKFIFGATATNLGGTMQFYSTKEKLPTSTRIGVAVAPFGNSFLTSVDLEKKAYGETVIHHGGQFAYRDQYFVRAGYNYYPDRDYRSLGTGVSFGGGIRFGGLTIDYAFTPGDSQVADDLHRFSLGIALTR